MAPDVWLQTSAGITGQPGGLQFRSRQADFLVKTRDKGTEVKQIIAYDAVSTVELSRRYFPIVLTRMKFSCDDASDLNVDVNASVRDVQGALAHYHPASPAARQ